MFDWNNDGKTNWDDDAIFHEVINKDDESANTATPQRSHRSSRQTSSASKWIINGLCALCLYVVYQLYCGGVPINGFSALLCLGCAIRLAFSFFSSF